MTRLKAAGAYFKRRARLGASRLVAADTPEAAQIDAYSWGRQNCFDLHAEEKETPRPAREDATDGHEFDVKVPVSKDGRRAC